MDVASTDLHPFPVSRYIYYGQFRYYYAYGNTPAEDFLENITEAKVPAVLLLGCGDMRSCFYTLWKNFDPQHKRPFSGIHFVLNDYSAAVLARNILFLYLCLQMPSRKDDLKKWVAALWSIWYCHELLPEHELVLKDALTNLLRWSNNHQSSSEITTSALSKIVHFASASTLHQIRYYWEAWYNGKIGPGSVQELRAMRKDLKMSRRTDSTSFEISSTSLGLLGEKFSLRMLEAMDKEIQSYFDSGNAFAESVLDLTTTTGETVINPTLFERSDGQYTLHYISEPYNNFFQTVVFSPKELKNMGTHKSLRNQLIVDDKAFETHLTLSNSVQQFWIVLSSAAAILAHASSHQTPQMSFTFQCCDALEFCQFLQHSTHEFASYTGFKPMFDLVHSSNLIDHLSPPNLVLSVVPILKENGYLLSTSLVYKNVAHTAEGYLQVCFGFESQLLPLICGIRCVGHEGKYASSVSPQPTSCNIGSVCLTTLSSKLLIWQRVSTLPLKLASLGSDSAVAILRALSSSISVAMQSFFSCSVGLRTTLHLSTQTAIQLLQRFVAQLSSDVAFTDYCFWEPLCATLRDREVIKPFILSLQTQALLHGVHLHLTVTKHNCPLCMKKPVSDAISQFSITLEEVVFGTPSFVVFLHRSSYIDLQQVLLSRGQDTHMIDCLAGSEIGGKLRLDFFAPQSFAEDSYQITACSFVLAQEVNIPTVVMHGKLADFKAPKITYQFQQLQSTLAAMESSFGKVIQHSGDGDQFESVVSLSDTTVSALEKQNLDIQRISDSEIKVSCGSHTIQISYPHPIYYNSTSIKLSRKKKMVTVQVPRKVHQYFEEMPLFVANPDNKLSLPPVSISYELSISFCGMQFTKKDRDIMKECNREAALMPAELNLKEAMNVLFQFQSSEVFHLSFSSSDFHGLLMIHNRLFDQQNKTPAIDLSFCFLEMSFVHQVAPALLEIIPDKVRTIIVSEEEYELLKKVLHHFARRTITTSRKPYGCMPLLIKHKIDRYFTRAVVYPLYPDPDIFAEDMGMTMGVNEPYPSTAVTTPHFRMPAIKEIETQTKCTFCGTQSDMLKKCGCCGKAQYCGKICQKKHWKKHKIICNPQGEANPSDPAESLPSTSNIDLGKCEGCEKDFSSLKKCRCHQVAYCSVECQRKDWQKHRDICTAKKQVQQVSK